MPTLQSTEYERFLSSVQPAIIGLKDCAVSLDRKAYHRINREASRKSIVRNLAAGYTVEHVDKLYFDVAATIRVSISHPDVAKEPLSVECSFECHFHADKPINAEHVRRFAEAELRIVMWPYFRNFVADITAKMSIQPLMIPIVLRRETTGTEAPLKRSRSTGAKRVSARSR